MGSDNKPRDHLRVAIHELRKVVAEPSGLWLCPFWLSELNKIVAKINELALQDTFLEMDRSRE